MSQTTKTVLLAALILVALAVVGFFVLRSGGTSGTVESVPQQMKPGTRSHRGQ